MKKYHISLMTAMTLLLTACEYKELTDGTEANRPQKTFIVNFDWNRVQSSAPSMRIAFYADDFKMNNRAGEQSNGYTFFDIPNAETALTLPVGSYHVTAWNNNTEYVITGNINDRNTLFATTDTYSAHGDTRFAFLVDSIFAGQRVLDYPDYMVHANTMAFELTDDNTPQRLTMYPDSMVITMEVRMKGVKGLEWCQNIRGAISNAAGKRFMAFDNLTEDAVTVMFDAQPIPEQDEVYAKFWLFGIEPTATPLQHKMAFFFWLPGGKVFLTADVTEALRKYSGSNSQVEIVIPNRDIDLRAYMKNGGTGMVVTADDWQETEDIPLNF